MQYQMPSLIGAQTPAASNAFLDRLGAARSAGPISTYDYKIVKPKKQLKEIIKVLKPEIERLQESLSKKYKNLDKMVERISDQYTQDIEAFGNKWIYGEKGTMEAFDKAFMKDGVFNTEKYIKQIEIPYSGK